MRGNKLVGEFIVIRVVMFSRENVLLVLDEGGMG